MSEPPVSHPSPLAALRDEIGLCVHCGFCLQACPTYLAVGEENDSPRGRILLMRAMADGELASDDPIAMRHLDQCLGCRGCETACPSGVPYGTLLEAARAGEHERGRTPRTARAVLWVFARPRVLAAVLALARMARATRLAALLAHLPGRGGFAAAMLAATAPVRLGATRGRERTRGALPAAPRKAAPPSQAQPQPAARDPSPESHATRVAILQGCVMRGLFAGTNRATARVLAANGYHVHAASGQQCCGALHAHAGDLDTARRLARVNIAAFERSNANVIVVNAAGCGAAMKEYGHLLHHDPVWRHRAAAAAARVRDVSEVLADAGPRRASALPQRVRVTYDAPCHLHHAQRVTNAPMQMLAAIAELTLEPLADADQCCGSAGIYNLLQPALALDVLERKLEHIASTGADIVATGNPGCLMQIGAGLRRSGHHARVMHPVDLLDAAYRAGEP